MVQEAGCCLITDVLQDMHQRVMILDRITDTIIINASYVYLQGYAAQCKISHSTYRNGLCWRIPLIVDSLTMFSELSYNQSLCYALIIDQIIVPNFNEACITIPVSTVILLHHCRFTAVSMRSYHTNDMTYARGVLSRALQVNRHNFHRNDEYLWLNIRPCF